jgi:opacity protein-like surface antigen
VGIGFGISFQNFDTPIDLDPAYGFDVWGGYRFDENFAAELQLEYLNGFKSASVAPLKLSFQGITWTANVKGYLLTGRWQPFALVGIGLQWAQFRESVFNINTTSTSFAARLGGGLDFYITETLALNVNGAYIQSTDEFEGADYGNLVIGAQYRF